MATDTSVAEQCIAETRAKLDACGYTLDRLLEEMRGPLEAKKSVFQKIAGPVTIYSKKLNSSRQAKAGDRVGVARVISCDEDGSLLEIVVTDMAQKQSAVELLLKLRGDFPGQKIDITDTRMVQSILAALPLEAQAQVKEAIKEKAKK